VEFICYSAITTGSKDTPQIRHFTGQCRSTSRQMQVDVKSQIPDDGPIRRKHMVKKRRIYGMFITSCCSDEIIKKNISKYFSADTRKYISRKQDSSLRHFHFSHLLTNQPMCSGRRVSWQNTAGSKSLNSRRYTSWKQVARGCFKGVRDEKRTTQFRCTYIRINLANWPR
jgi:hypothetical protein